MNNSGNHRSTSFISSHSRELGLLLGIVAVTAGIAFYWRRNAGTLRALSSPKDVKLESHTTINCSPETVYRFWKDFKNLPQVMSFLERVERQEGDVYHWVARGPAGPGVEWDAEVVDDQPNKLLAWRSLEGSEIQTWGTVLFNGRNDNRGTEVAVAFNFSPPFCRRKRAHRNEQVVKAVCWRGTDDGHASGTGGNIRWSRQ
ncbi:SRPBCC family protein [Marinobacter sp. ATCH36]|uniref:SRPBCC family protein n=1 Tax=Marinobacter sp. ATCH36 TaxID=2945106 RepID=UPI00202109AE|nr:SRPBCC family protein [Marinobacter sp. ATCH36]MCL7945386.1 SRPBCC family protein [Marinobacter sp. ATCH36]